MAKVPLRKYNSEIEALIDRGQTDEAIAHCRHILKTFPKHLETYRLLGKAYLETKRYVEATDIFKRVLMAVPDDFVSHVGMSIIADDQKRLDDAIWHMERAFEAQPSNAAIQAELQRLYGRRDGREPPKIRLTRGALAHMYAQGELYAQAIGEIRSVLGEEPNRTDMQVLLALAYFRSGQKVEASEVCSQLIGRFPYCLDANRVLMEILPGTGLAESIQTYRQRVVELDPYAAYTTGSIFLANETQDSTVNLDRLEYKGQPVETGPEWGKALGISMGAGAASAVKTEPVPTASRPSVFPKGDAVAQDKPGPAAPAPGGEAIPEWMREAGWSASTGAFDESASPFNDETAADDLPKADLPDWIKSMAPAETKISPTPSSASSGNDDTAGWLNKLGGDKPFDFAQDKPFDFGQDKPFDFVQDKPFDFAQDKPFDFAQDKPFEEIEQKMESAADLSPNWPSSSNEVQPTAAPSASIGDLGSSAAEQDAAMLWLEGLAAKQGAKSEELITNPEERPEKPPEWVEQAKAAGESQPAAPGASIGDLGSSEAEQDSAMLWLEGLAAKQGAKSEELITNPEERPEKPPAWVEQAKATGESKPAAFEEPSAADQTGIWLRELEEKDERAEAQQPDQSAEIEFAPPPPSVPAARPAVDVDLPTWLRGLEEHEAASASAISDEMPEWLRGDEPEVPAPPEPTRPADWTPEASTEVTPPAALEPKPRIREVRKPQSKPEAPPPPDKTKVRRTGMLPPLIDPALAAAREAMAHGKIPDALQAYGNIIRKGKLLEDITFDLKEALYRFPVEVSIWQVLGDAYMRANRLQDALDAYTKAEELIR